MKFNIDLSISFSKTKILSVELEKMLIDQGVSLNDVENGEIDRPFGLYKTEQSDKILWGHEGSGSGGYANFIFKYAARNLFQEANATVEFKNLRNPDFKEAVLEKDGKILLRFAIANGFKNIQNLVQKLKRGKSTYHYVEVMACPSGKFFSKLCRVFFSSII